MVKQLSFSEEYRYDDNLSGIELPVVLGYGARSIRVWAKVDTGAAVCLFSHEDGKELGLEVEHGLPITLYTLGDPVAAYEHGIILQTGELVFRVWSVSPNIQACRVISWAEEVGCAKSNLPWWLMTTCSTSALTTPEDRFSSENT
jgi:hypothetical protein